MEVFCFGTGFVDAGFSAVQHPDPVFPDIGNFRSYEF
jgi:hypothetical protein